MREVADMRFLLTAAPIEQDNTADGSYHGISSVGHYWSP